ncbi:MAG: wax ester/triacylglycerol synthase family O-acyltransferase, partial [Thermoleophilaceae bacterium]|nr:wax ester/triacylglycerol synthase family O-acyltransferase [Thermoleophilaceae bacterium]
MARRCAAAASRPPVAPRVEHLSPSDLSALQAERPPVHMHVGGMLIFGRPPTRADVADRIRERLHLIPRYGMRLDEAPLGISHPVWEDDPDFDPADHVHAVGLPAPGGMTELHELMGREMSTPLDRGRPLWEMWVVEGLEGGRGAIVAKMHHALVDGLAAIDVSTVILDPTPEKLEVPPPEPAATPPAERRAAMAEPLTRLAAPYLNVPRKMARSAVD